jgi:hypothetical protein
MSNAGELHTFPVSAGLLDPRHVQAIDPSSPWPIYLWFLEHVTRDEQEGDYFLGIVLNGRPLRIREIAGALGIEYHSCRRHLAHLVTTGYLKREKTGVGMFTYTVTKSKRWAWKRHTAGARNQQSSAPEKQGSLFPQTQEPTEQNLQHPTPPTEQNLKHPQSRICTQGERERARDHSKPVTKRISHKAKKPARDFTEQALRIASEHPWLAHLKGKKPSRSLERAIVQAITEAIVRDGADCVEAGTRILRDAVHLWPDKELQYIPNAVKFYEQSGYLKKAAAWERTSRTKGDEYARQVEGNHAVLRRMQSGGTGVASA